MNPFETSEISITLKIDTEMLPFHLGSLAFLADVSNTYADGPASRERTIWREALGTVLWLSSAIGTAILPHDWREMEESSSPGDRPLSAKEA